MRSLLCWYHSIATSPPPLSQWNSLLHMVVIVINEVWSYSSMVFALFRNDSYHWLDTSFWLKTSRKLHLPFTQLLSSPLLSSNQGGIICQTTFFHVMHLVPPPLLRFFIPPLRSHNDSNTANCLLFLRSKSWWITALFFALIVSSILPDDAEYDCLSHIIFSFDWGLIVRREIALSIAYSLVGCRIAVTV